MAADHDEARRAAERVARESFGRLVAFLAARTGDVAGAQDALADAFTEALRAWPVAGVPASPCGWVLTAARRRQTDARRRHKTGRDGEAQLILMREEIEALTAASEEIPDRRLALMFACAHPDIEPNCRAPLILQTILGLTAAEIGAAFLVPPAAMGQRLVRAKARIKQMELGFHVPEGKDLPARVVHVLDAVYAAYTKAWSECGEAQTSPLVTEAIWLAQLVVLLLPEEPEAKGVLALMHYAQARIAARRDAEDAYAPLEAHDVRLWDFGQIRRAEDLLRQANAQGASGRYQIEAAIQSAHVARRLKGESNWREVVALYDLLSLYAPSPVVTLNRAVALANVAGPVAALAAMEPLAEDRRMAAYQPYWAALGHLCAEIGRREQAHQALILALGLSADPAVRIFLQLRIDGLQSR